MAPTNPSTLQDEICLHGRGKGKEIPPIHPCQDNISSGVVLQPGGDAGLGDGAEERGKGAIISTSPAWVPLSGVSTLVFPSGLLGISCISPFPHFQGCWRSWESLGSSLSKISPPHRALPFTGLQDSLNSSIASLCFPLSRG